MRPGYAKQLVVADRIRTGGDCALLRVKTAAGPRRNEKEAEAGERVLRAERPYGNRYRALRSASRSAKTPRARSTEGVLKVTVPKKAATQAKRITIS